MSAATGQKDAGGLGFAAAAGQAGAQVDAVFKLEEAALAIGVNVVRKTEEPPRRMAWFEHLEQGLAEAFEFGAGEAAGSAAGRMPE